MAQPFPTVRPPRQRLLIFARVPELGSVKTRLAATLGDERTLQVYDAMLRDLLAGVGRSDERTEIEVVWTASPGVSGETLREVFGGHSLAKQTGETLGDRLAMAFSERFFFERTQKIIAIGTDDPTLIRETIDHAFALLDSCEWVIGPAADGGYYLIGARAQTFDPEIFRDIAWSTPSVLETTIEKIRRWEQTMATLPERIDIDAEDDLRRVAAAGELRGELAGVVREWLDVSG
jgi:rSAM/selenodomain-associated transferase 1